MRFCPLISVSASTSTGLAWSPEDSELGRHFWHFNNTMTIVMSSRGIRYFLWFKLFLFFACCVHSSVRMRWLIDSANRRNSVIDISASRQKTSRKRQQFVYSVMDIMIHQIIIIGSHISTEMWSIALTFVPLESDLITSQGLSKIFDVLLQPLHLLRSQLPTGYTWATSIGTEFRYILHSIRHMHKQRLLRTFHLVYSQYVLIRRN